MNTAGKNTPFLILTVATLIGLIWPVLIQDGMFMDSMLYTCVAHNLGQGVGTFWFPQFSAQNIAGLSSFHEQPPLVSGIEALFFKVLGSSMYVERFYTALTSIIAALLMRKLWVNLAKKNNNLEGLSWLPVLLWITVSACFWSYRGNMHENTMTIFCLLSILSLQNWFTDRGWWRFIAGAFYIVLAVLCKGLPGLFPLAAPILYAIVTREVTLKKAALATAGMGAFVTAFFGVLLLFEESRNSLNIYFFQRLVQRISEVPTVDSRFYIIGQLFMEQLAQIILVAIVLLFKRNRQLALPHWRQALFFIAIGLAGSLPLALTLVQKSFYFVPALPLFAIAFALLIAPAVSLWIQKLTETWHKPLLVLSVLTLVSALALTVSKIGGTARDEELLHDVYAMGKIIPPRATISIPHELWNRWDLKCYLMRYFSISAEDSQDREYMLTYRHAGEVPGSYVPIDADLYGYRIFKKR